MSRRSSRALTGRRSEGPGAAGSCKSGGRALFPRCRAREVGFVSVGSSWSLRLRPRTGKRIRSVSSEFDGAVTEEEYSVLSTV